ncbi:MAG: hypothetical protein U1E83_05635 [Methylotetracoccus sp.]
MSGTPTINESLDPDQFFIRNNFHRPESFKELVDALSAEKHRRPRVIRLYGRQTSSKTYLLQAAAHAATLAGHPTAVAVLDLQDFEPDRTTLKDCFQRINQRLGPTKKGRLNQLLRAFELDINLKDV